MPLPTSEIVAGNARAVARALRDVDDRAGDWLALLKDLFPHTGKAFIVGITGNPGAGKSTLTDRLIAASRAKSKRVGVLCVDPTSPYTGGAILGDRIRMQRHALDDGVFIRSIATRGHLGGLSRSARDMVRVLDAAGCDVVYVETVGVGQDELEITRTAHSTLVVMAPGLGDEVQAIKAGILETADVFAVNKADRDGADATMRDLELMIALGSEAMIASGKTKGHGGAKAAAKAIPTADATTEVRWIPPIHKCVATRGEGIDDLMTSLDRHHEWLTTTTTGQARRRTRLAEELRESLRETLIEAAMNSLGYEIEAAVAEVDARKIDPYTATERLLAAFKR